jgi:hypothetical protein
MIEWPGWDRKVMVIIMLNTMCLAMYDPFDKESMRPCDPDAGLSVPYLYCDKWGTGKFPASYNARVSGHGGKRSALSGGDIQRPPGVIGY